MAPGRTSPSLLFCYSIAGWIAPPDLYSQFKRYFQAVGQLSILDRR